MCYALSKIPASAVASAAIIAPFPTRLARPSNVLRFSDAVAPPGEEVLFDGCNRDPFKVDALGDQQERI